MWSLFGATIQARAGSGVRRITYHATFMVARPWRRRETTCLGGLTDGGGRDGRQETSAAGRREDTVGSSEDHLERLIDRSVSEHRRRKDLVRRASWGMRIASMVLSAGATVVLGVGSGGSSFEILSRNLALGMSAAVAFLTSLAGFWNVDRYWVAKKLILLRLVALQQEFDFRRSKAEPLTEAELDDYFARFQGIIAHNTRYWEDVSEGLATSGTSGDARGGQS
jgi:hypothetical protein